MAKEFKDGVEALYAVSYAVKFMIKKEKAIDHGVMPLEGLWWTDDMSKFNMENKDIWKWTVMIMQPQFMNNELFDKAMKQVHKKRNPPALSKIRFESLHERLSAQIMHIGPYSAKVPTVTRLHGFIRERDYELSGKHHEIYLSDPRKAALENSENHCQTANTLKFFITEAVPGKDISVKLGGDYPV